MTTNSESRTGIPTGYIFVGERDRRVMRTVDLGRGVIVDVDANDCILGIETIGHTDFTAAAWLIASSPHVRIAAPPVSAPVIPGGQRDNTE